MKPHYFVRTPLASLVLLALMSDATFAEEKHDHSQIENDSVMIVTAPVSTPLEIVTSPKIPRQPVPASDGSDYLKTIPGFSQIRNGGTNGDPVFRGMFGSRLRILTDNGEMLGACPARMDAPSSYISPESFDVLTLIKGPQTVLWGPGNSAGTIRFDREQPRFEKAGGRVLPVFLLRQTIAGMKMLMSVWAVRRDIFASLAISHVRMTTRMEMETACPPDGISGMAIWL